VHGTPVHDDPAERDHQRVPGESAIGAAVATLNEPNGVRFATVVVPVFNLVPPGRATHPKTSGPLRLHRPARAVLLDTSIRGGDYTSWSTSATSRRSRSAREYVKIGVFRRRTRPRAGQRVHRRGREAEEAKSANRLKNATLTVPDLPHLRSAAEHRRCRILVTGEYRPNVLREAADPHGL